MGFHIVKFTPLNRGLHTFFTIKQQLKVSMYKY